MYNLEGKVQKNLSNNETNFIIPNNCVVVCPWVIRNGATNITEVGYVNSSANPDQYGFFQKVFTGNECITATWEDSTFLSKIENEYSFKYNFQVGKYYEGAVVVGTGEYGSEIETMEGNEDFLAMKGNGSLVIRFQDWVPNNNDIYKLYTIPDLYGAKWFYISNVKMLNDLQFQEGIDVHSVPACEVTFTTLVDKLQNSGKAVEQYVQYAGAGEPYIVPLVLNYNSDTTGSYVEPTKKVTYYQYQPQGVRYIQVELQGANALSGLQVTGRKLTYVEDTTTNNGYWKSSPWKTFLPHKLVNNQINDINRTSLPSRNFYFFQDASMDFITSKTFQEDVKTRNDALAQNQQAGKITTTGWNNKETGKHNSNKGPADDWSLLYDCNDASWKPATASSYVNNTSGNFYSVGTINYTTNDSMLDILTKNGFIYNTQPVLPLGLIHTKPYHIKSIPIIGNLVSRFYGDLTINPNTTRKPTLPLSFFMDSSVASMLVNIFSGDGTAFPTNALCGDESKASRYYGTSALNTTLCFSITDKVKEGSTVYDTLYFGQKKDENGNYILGDHTTYLYGRDNQVKEIASDSDIFVIDQVTVYALHKGKIKVSCYGKELDNQTGFYTVSPIFTTTVQSKAKWTDSIRDWETIITIGNWNENWVTWTPTDFPWPERPDKELYPKIDVNLQIAKNIEADDMSRTDIKVLGIYQYDFSSTQSLGNNNIGYFGQTSNLWTQTYNYSDLNVPAVVDETTLKQYFSRIEIPIDNAYIQNIRRQDKEWITVEKRDNPVISFDINTTNYDTKILGVGASIGQEPVVYVNGGDAVLQWGTNLACKGNETSLEHVANYGGFYVVLKPQIIYNTNSFTVNMNYQFCWFCNTNEIEYFNTYGNVYSRIHRTTGIHGWGIGKIRFGAGIKTINFIPRT